MKTFIKSYWVKPNKDEINAPEDRIIHGVYFRFGILQNHFRVGFGLGRGYFKCGSDPSIDWVGDAEIFAWINGDWQKINEVKDLDKPLDNNITWVDIDVETMAVFISIRKSGVDDWWPCYTMAATCVQIDKIDESKATGRPRRYLHNVIGKPDVLALEKENITVFSTSVSTRYSTPYYSIGFKLKSVGLDFLSCDGEGKGKVFQNLLDKASILYDGYNDFHIQGLVIASNENNDECSFMQYTATGTTELYGNSIIYSVHHNTTGQKLKLVFTMFTNEIKLSIEREVENDIRLLDSSPFRIAFSAQKAPLTVLGSVMKSGETGRVELPFTLNLPGYSNIAVIGNKNFFARYNSIRYQNINNFDIHLGEQPIENGCYLIKKGTYFADASFKFGFENHIELKEETPELVKAAFNKYLLSSLTYRADVATLTNNGNSMGTPICLGVWSDLCKSIGDGINGVNTFEFLKNTIETSLLGAPAYAAGNHQSGTHKYEDEYLMTGATVLYGIGNYMSCVDDKNWYNKFEKIIKQKLIEMKNRDIDDDGLIESTLRRGVSGEHQWSTNWYDVISYGYKDSMSNAILYSALIKIATKIEQYGETEYSKELLTWSEKLKENYITTFMTDKGWLAGWKCFDGKLHDYGFLAANGIAVEVSLLEGEQAKSVLSKLYDALISTGFDSFDLGLPGNVFDVVPEDNAQPQLPFGGYENAGITLSQSDHFISGLYRVGMVKEADNIIGEIAKGLLYGNVVSGVGTGSDWATWDGTATGYEGILCDQFGVLIPMIERYRKK